MKSRSLIVFVARGRDLWLLRLILGGVLRRDAVADPEVRRCQRELEGLRFGI